MRRRQTQRTWFVLLALMLVATCVHSPPHDRDCPTLEVRNDNWLDATVALTNPPRRLGTVTGLTTRTMTFCSPTNPDAEIAVHMIGGDSFTLTSRGSATFHDGLEAVARLTSTLRGSYLR